MKLLGFMERIGHTHNVGHYIFKLEKKGKHFSCNDEKIKEIVSEADFFNSNKSLLYIFER